MENIILKIENVSKQYRLGVVGTGTLSHDLNRWWYQLRGKEDPYLKIGDTNKRDTKGDSDYVWALKDINFEVKKGEVLGIIGKNGAGKSTLLKILSQVTAPTTGSIKSKGRIASLLEVGTGFHPELTGKENIYLNGAILGMTKAEIAAKYDEIVEFSGVARYVDTPVKRYSSGMKVRLAFAVAAHLEPEILVVDEVLAVGDAEFQKKAIGKMQEISKEGGRTVLFVSHNMVAVQNLCTKGILLENGIVKHSGSITEVINIYLSNLTNNNSQISWDQKVAPGTNQAKITNIKLSTKNNLFYIEEEIYLEIEYINFVDNQILNTSVSVFNDMDVYIFSSPNLNRIPLKKGKYISVLKIPSNFFNKGVFSFTVLLVGNNFEILVNLDKIISINIDEKGLLRKEYFGFWGGVVRPNFEWKNLEIKL